jgi:hypothetical protein
MWIKKLYKDFLAHQKLNPNLTPKDILIVIAAEVHDDFKDFDAESIYAISNGLEKILEDRDINTDWDVPTPYQVKAANIFKEFLEIRKTDRERNRITDSLLFKLVFSRAFNVKPNQATMSKALASDKNLKAVSKKMLDRLTKLGYTVKDDKDEISPNTSMVNYSE